MDRQQCQKLVERGGLLRLAQPAPAPQGPKDLAREIRSWLAEAAAANGSPDSKLLLPAVEFLKGELEQKLRDLASIKQEE